MTEKVRQYFISEELWTFLSITVLWRWRPNVQKEDSPTLFHVL